MRKPVMHPDRPGAIDEVPPVFKKAKRIPHRKPCLCSVCDPHENNHSKPASVPEHKVAFDDVCLCPQCNPIGYTWHDKTDELVPHRRNCNCGICNICVGNCAQPVRVPGHEETDPKGMDCTCPQCCPAEYTWHSKQRQEATLARWEREQSAPVAVEQFTEDGSRVSPIEHDPAKGYKCPCPDCVAKRVAMRCAQVEAARDDADATTPNDLINAIEMVKGLADAKLAELIRARDLLIRMLQQKDA